MRAVLQKKPFALPEFYQKVLFLKLNLRTKKSQNKNENMNKESDWYKDFKAETEKQVTAFKSKRDFHFFRIDRLQHIAKKTDELAELCPQCKDNKQLLTDLSKELSIIVNSTGKKRREYEQAVDGIIKHLRTDHQLVPAKYYQYTYSWIGFITGLVCGLITAIFIERNYLKFIILASIAIGIIAGNITGSRKDAKLRKQNKQF